MWFSRNFPHAVSEIKVVYLWVWGLQYRWSAFAWQWPRLSNWLWMWVPFSVARLRIPSWPFVYGLFCTCWFMLNSMPGGGSWVGATKQWNRGYEDCLFVTPWSTHHFSYIHIYIDNIKIPNHLEICKLKHELDSLQIWIPWCITNETYGNHGALTALQCYSFIQLSSILVLKMDVCAAPLVGMSRNDWTTEIQIFWDQTCAASWPILIFRISWEIFRIVP